MIFATGLGPVSVAPGTTARILTSRIPIVGGLVEHSWEQLDENIIIGLRLPRVCLGLVVGASLAVCGVTMQALVRNNLADPFILGVSNGAAVFATLGMLFGAFSFLGTYSLSISAFIGSAVTIIFVYMISRVRGRVNIMQLLLSGVAISMIMDGITSIIKLSAPNALGLHNAEFWMSGSLAGAKWAYLTLPLAVLLICMAVLMINYRGLNLLLLGEESAGALGVNVSEIEAPFELKDRPRSELVAEVREKLGTITGANIEIGQPISHRIDAMLSGTKANIAIKLFGDDLNKMFSLGNQIKGAISDIPGIADLNVEQQIERPQLKIQPKREMLAKFGITLPEFSEYVNVALAGKVISQVYEQGKSFDLIVKVKDDARDEMEKIRNLMVDTNDGRKVPLNYVAEVVSSMGPNTINRENVKRKIVISANVADRDLRSVVNDIQKQVDATIQLPEGYHIEYGGQFESEQAASRVLALTSFMSIVIIFLLLYHEFRSVKESGVILLNLPLALIGGVFALVITTGEVSIPAIIGFISLFGIATRNGMLLISHYNHLQQVEGLNVYDSVVQGSLDRLNPILMTALSSALALIPLALGGDLPGNEIQSPMAKVILGGLLTSTFLNGFIVPIVYLMMHRQHSAGANSPCGVPAEQA